MTLVGQDLKTIETLVKNWRSARILEMLFLLPQLWKHENTHETCNLQEASKHDVCDDEHGGELDRANDASGDEGHHEAGLRNPKYMHIALSGKMVSQKMSKNKNK